MSSNLIVFDSQYASSQVKNFEKAQSILEEAIGTLKNASAHNGWRCPEATQISNSMNEIGKRLARLNQGVEGTSRALNTGMQRFQELENRSEMQSNNLSSSLQSSYGAKASNLKSGNKISLPVTMVPAIGLQALTVSPKTIIQSFQEISKKLIEWLKKVLGLDDNNNTANSTPTPSPSPAPSATPAQESTPSAAASSDSQTPQQTANSTNTAATTTPAPEPEPALVTSSGYAGGSTPDLSSDYYDQNVKTNTKTFPAHSEYNSSDMSHMNCVHYARARYLEVNGKHNTYSFTTIDDANGISEAIKNGNCVVRVNGHSVYVENYDAATDTVWYSDSNWGSDPDGTLKSKSFNDFRNNFKGGVQYVEQYNGQ